MIYGSVALKKSAVKREKERERRRERESALLNEKLIWDLGDIKEKSVLGEEKKLS